MKLLLICTSLFMTTSAFSQGKYEEKIQRRIDEAITDYNYPISPRTKRITYRDTVYVYGSDKATLLKRFDKFLSFEDFGKIENVRCKNNTNITTSMFEKVILYKDSVDGEIICNGYTPFEIVKLKSTHLRLVFKMKIKISKDKYEYEITDFTVYDFMGAPKDKTKGSGSGVAIGYSTFSSNSRTTSFSASDVVIKDLEEFIIEGFYRDNDRGHFVFKNEIKRLKSDLKSIMSGGL